MVNLEELELRMMVRSEVDELVHWAELEGWNPGLHDAGIFWATDPEAFIAADLHDELIGGGAITSYGGEFGFMGFFIVRPEYRLQGIGNVIWHYRRDRLINRLQPGATIGLDGVFEMQPYYKRGGFVFSHRNIRYRNVFDDVPAVDAAHAANIVPLAEVPFEQVMTYDRACFPAPRATFLRAWFAQPEALALGYVDDGRLAGYGVIRRCGDGCKVGPLFADNEAVAEALYLRLAGFADGGPIFLDAPENNPAAMALAARYQMEEVFGTARMYLGDFPSLADERIFGVTTFELG